MWVVGEPTSAVGCGELQQVGSETGVCINRNQQLARLCSLQVARPHALLGLAPRQRRRQVLVLLRALPPNHSVLLGFVCARCPCQALFSAPDTRKHVEPSDQTAPASTARTVRDP